MRIISLVPEATEILQALGLGDQTAALPVDTDATPETLADAMRTARPDLIFASESAAEGGVPRSRVRRAVAGIRPRPPVYALEPHTLGDILSDIKTVGDATGRQQHARALIEALRARIDEVTLRSAHALAERPPRRVACLTGTDPPVAAGWWLAELVGLAGGLDVLGGIGRPARAVTPAEVRAARPELVVWVGGERPSSTVIVHAVSGAIGEGRIFPGPGAITLLEQFAARIHHDRDENLAILSPHGTIVHPNG